MSLRRSPAMLAAEVVQVIGRVATLYRENPEIKRQQEPPGPRRAPC